MMLIGLGIASMDTWKPDIRFISLAFIAKFLAWPIIVISFIFLDKAWMGFYEPVMYDVMILMSVVPMAANVVAFATQLDTHPGKASLAVLASTIVALFFIPLTLVLLGVS
jgi:hypothetical protein